MGNSQPTNNNEVDPTNDPSTFKALIQQSILSRRIKLNHQANIFAKLQYLQTHYAQYSAQFDELHLTHNMISTQFMNLLSKVNLSNLKALVLSNNDIICEAIKPIKNMPLRLLQYLHLDSNQIGNDGCYYLTKTNLQSLLTLDLNNNLIEDEGCKNLARAVLPNLRTLLIWLLYLSAGEWPLLAFIQAKNNLFEPNKQLQKIKFRSQVKFFRLEIQ